MHRVKGLFRVLVSLSLLALAVNQVQSGSVKTLTDKLTLYDSIAAVNIARMNPTKMAVLIEGAYKERMNAQCQIPNWQVALKEKCPQVLDETLEYLRSVDSINGLVPNLCLTKIAYDYSRKMAIQDRLAENTIYKETEAVVTKTGPGLITNIGNDKDDVGVIIDFLIGDGDSKKLNRLALMNPEYKQIGVGVFSAGQSGMYVTYGYSKGYTCDPAKVPCEEQNRIGWTGYLNLIGVTNSCTEELSHQAPAAEASSNQASVKLEERVGEQLPEESVFNPQVEQSFDDAYQFKKFKAIDTEESNTIEKSGKGKSHGQKEKSEKKHHDQHGIL